MTDGKYFYLGEAYHPTYKTETDYDGLSKEVFDGYEYTNAIIAAFDTLGNKLWDYSFELNILYKPMQIVQFVNFSVINNNLYFVYQNRREIYFHAINPNGTVIDDGITTIKTKDEKDNIKYANSVFNYWYDNYLIFFGYQQIKKQINEGEKIKRKVYFIDKLGIE